MAASGASEDIAVALWAAQSGLFARNGLDVDVARMTNSASITSAVLGGSLEIGKSSVFSLVLARGKGLPIVLEAGAALYDASEPDDGMLVAKDSPIKSARDLNGKTIGSASLGDFFSLLDAAWIDANGGDSKSVRFLELPAPTLPDALVAGRVDAGSVPEPILSDAVKSGKCRILGYPNSAIGKRSIVTAYFCTSSFAGQNVDALRRFRAATMNSTLATSANLKDLPLTQSTIDIAAKYRTIPKAFPVREMIDPNVFA